MRASDVPTAETLAFVLLHVPRARSRILEVGCGSGILAARLQALGHQVVAVDSSREAVLQAQQLEVDARQARWPDFEDSPFDVVLFTRSLHHIRPLVDGVRQARKLLRSDGRVVVEDFAFSQVDAPSLEWLYQILSVLDAARLLEQDRGGFAKTLLQQHGDMAAWTETHDRDLHSADAILACLKEHFSSVEAETVPYLYRYVVEVLEDDDCGYAIARRVLELERRGADRGRVSLIGRRFVGR